MSDYNERMIAYIYGEMTSEQKKEFEDILDLNPELKKDLDELIKMKEGLSGLQDKEIMEPFYMWKNKAGGALNRIINPRYTSLRYVAAIAASVIIVVALGFLLNVDIRYQEKTLAISFGEDVPSLTLEGLSMEEVTSIIRDEIARNNTYIVNQMEESENKMTTRFASMESSNKAMVPTQEMKDRHKENIEVLLARLNDQNLQTLQSYLLLTSNQQQRDFQEMLTGMSEFIEYQREEDLRRITRGLQTLKETQDEQKIETDRMFASLVSNVNYQNE